MSRATPLYAEQRRGNYVWQNNGGVMTPRQRRRLKHKFNRQLVAARKALDAIEDPR
jgi:hypothetical protein